MSFIISSYLSKHEIGILIKDPTFQHHFTALKPSEISPNPRNILRLYPSSAGSCLGR